MSPHISKAVKIRSRAALAVSIKIWRTLVYPSFKGLQKPTFKRRGSLCTRAEVFSRLNVSALRDVFTDRLATAACARSFGSMTLKIPTVRSTKFPKPTKEELIIPTATDKA